MKFTFPLLTAGFVACTMLGTSSLSAKSKAVQSTPSSDAAPSADAQPAKEKADLQLPDPVATVNGEKISKEDLEKAFQHAVGSSGVNLGELSNEQKLMGYRQLLDDMILDKLVEEKASKEEVSASDVDKELATIKGQFPDEKTFEEQLKAMGQSSEEFQKNLTSMLRQRKWLESQVGDQAVATEADAQAFYDANTDQFENPELVEASHILFMVPQDAPEDVVKAKEKAAKDAVERARKGEDFEALAKELSEEPHAAQSGGHLGLFSKDDMVPEFSNAAFSQKVGEISDPVRSQYGFHVIKVTDKKPAGKMTFDEVKDRLVAFLTRQKRSDAIKQVLKKLRDEAKVEVKLPEPEPAKAGNS